MKKHTITFFPENKSVDVDEGISIAEAARLAEVFINNLCGGEGVCGQCRVQVTKGQAEAEEQARSVFSGEEIGKGFVLACRTEIHDNLEIMIPPQSRVEGAQIVTGQATGDWGRLRHRPLVTKVYLELPPPSLEDNIADKERVFRELKKRLGLPSFDIPLDCLHNLSDTLRENNWKMTATVAKDRDRYRILKLEPMNTTSRHYGIALDVGTTTLVAQLVDLNSGKAIGVEGSSNLQAGYGEDVISRMIYACEKQGLEPLQQAVVRNINHLIEKLARENGISLEEIHTIVAAGNTTMSHFLLGLSPCFIRLEPYVPATTTYPQIFARDIGIHISQHGILETIPGVASYVGGDIVAGVMSCGITEHKGIRALIDIGTNGEIAVGNSEWLVCCSASAGPAFEGGGTRCGMRAIKGAIQKVNISDGQLEYETIGNTKPSGICGSGLIDCIYELVNNRIIGSNGKFNRELQHTRLTFRDTIPEFTIAYPDETETGEAIVITEPDIDNLIKSKGAVFAAIKSLVDYVGLGFDNMETLYVAGGFGNFLNIAKSVAIGLLPDIPQEKIRFIGNSSLTGARLSLISEACLEKCMDISKSMTNIELSNYLPFADEYIAALFLPHTDRKLFLSVKY